MPPGLASPSHLLVLLVVAFIALGPEQLPGALRQAGRFVAEVRHWSAGLQAEMERALTLDVPATRDTTQPRAGGGATPAEAATDGGGPQVGSPATPVGDAAGSEGGIMPAPPESP